MNIEFENPDSEIKQIKIKPTDSLDEIAKKLLECQKNGIRATARINGIELDNQRFHSIEDIQKTYNQEYQRKISESTNVSVGSFTNGTENVLSQEQLASTPSDQSNNNSSLVPEMEPKRTDTNVSTNEISETIQYVEVAPTDSIEVVAQKLETCSAQGIKAVAMVNDIAINNIEVQSAQEIVAKYKEQEDVQKELNKAGIILEKGFRYESKFKVNARQIRVGKYDRIQEIIKKLQFCKAHGIEAYVIFNGVELNTYDYMKFRLNDPYRIMAWYNKEQARLKEEIQIREISAANLEEKTKKTFFNEPITGATESSNPSSNQSAVENNFLRNSFDENSSQDKETPRMVAIGGTPYKIGNKVADDKLSPSQNTTPEKRNPTKTPAENQKDKEPETTARARNQSQQQAQQTQNQVQNEEATLPTENKGTITSTEMNTPFSFKAKVEVSNPSEIKIVHDNKVTLGSVNVPISTKSSNALLYDPETRNMHRLENIAHHNETDEEDVVIEENNDLEDDSIASNDGTSTDDTNNNAKNKESAVGPSPQAEVPTEEKKKIPKELLAKIIGFIKKNPYVLAILGIVLVLLISILFFLSFNDGSASEESKSTSYSEACDAIDIHTTSLSRNDFISKVQSYYSGRSGAYAKVFSDNAGTIYDIATRNGINPEMVIVRAAREGYSPGTNYNYWGMGCTNTGNGRDCIKYKSFSDGVLGYVKNISQYESVSAMMSRYSYIGRYWFKNTSLGAGKGGCYYYDSIKPFLSTDRASTLASVCGTSNNCNFNGSGNCVETTEEDQLAYAKWQVYSMARSRETIFGIPPDECEVPSSPSSSSDCTLFAQSDPRWGGISLGRSSTNMSRSGCAVTSIAIGISCSGTQVTVDNFDAGVFIRKLNSGGCFTSSGAINWGCNAITQIAPQVHLAGMHRQIGKQSNDQKKAIIESYNGQKVFILVHYVNSAHPRGHYVVVSEIKGNNFITKDPAGGKITSVPIKDVDQIVVYSH